MKDQSRLRPGTGGCCVRDRVRATMLQSVSVRTSTREPSRLRVARSSISYYLKHSSEPFLGWGIADSCFSCTSGGEIGGCVPHTNDAVPYSTSEATLLLPS